MNNQLSDNELVSEALRNWANFIETRSIAYSRTEMLKLGWREHGLPVLSEEQTETVERLRLLANKYREIA